MAAFIEAWNQVFDEPSSTSDVEDEVLDNIHRVLFCAGRSTEECWPGLKHDFRHLLGLIASRIKSLPDSSGPQWPPRVFRWHCILDMAMRLHKRIPNIIDKTLFESLHTRSMKMFDLYVEDEEDGYGNLARYIGEEAKRESQTLDVSTRSVDWDEVLERYVEVEVRGVGEYTEYGDKWDYQRLQVDCKHRMEFILNFEEFWDDRTRWMVSGYKF